MTDTQRVNLTACAVILIYALIAAMAACSSSPTAPAAGGTCASQISAANALYGAGNADIVYAGATEEQIVWTETYTSGPPKVIDVLFDWSSGSCVESPVSAPAAAAPAWNAACAPALDSLAQSYPLVGVDSLGATSEQATFAGPEGYSAVWFLWWGAPIPGSAPPENVHHDGACEWWETV